MGRADALTGLAPAFLLNMFQQRHVLPPWLPTGAEKPVPALAIRRHGRILENPLGVAAGPHSQMAQNIVAAWLAGARWVELKTVQVLDDLHISKPCIFARDEGYNCEWSQELSLEHSFAEYLKAALVIRALRAESGHSGPHGEDVEDSEDGFQFNMSAGYTLEGLQSPPMRRFFARMADCRADAARLLPALEAQCPALAGVEHPAGLSASITLSTMHGCPPEDIEAMGAFLLNELGLHTTIKLNPTLLGPEKLRHLLGERLGHAIQVPDAAFAHDLDFSAAVDLIRSLRGVAERAGRDLHIKLTNTLECINTGPLPAQEKHVYLSGAPLHPISLAVALDLQRAFAGELDLSFCAGLNADNIAAVYATGMAPLTLCTDLLKPGSYTRLSRALSALNRAVDQSGCTGQNQYVLQTSGMADLPSARLAALEKAAARAAEPGGPYAAGSARASRRAAPGQTSRPCPANCRICATVCPNLALAALPADHALAPTLCVVHLADLCNQCGNCSAFCPCGHDPWRHKPHLHLTPQSLEDWQEGTLYTPGPDDGPLPILTPRLRKLLDAAVHN